MPECYIIAGPNGAGKTTFAREFLPKFMDCTLFINPDLIAAGLSPFDVDRAMLKAGRLVLEEISNCIRKQKTFAFETTLAGRSYARIIDLLHEQGYQVNMFYLWIPSPDLSVKRIQQRVKEGGHNVPEEDARRRFHRSFWNLFNLYRKRIDILYFIDNSKAFPKLIFLDNHNKIIVYEKELYDSLLDGESR